MKKRIAMLTIVAIIFSVTVCMNCTSVKAEELVPSSVTTEELCKEYTNGHNPENISVTDYVNDYFKNYDSKYRNGRKVLFSLPLKEIIFKMGVFIMRFMMEL